VDDRLGALASRALRSPERVQSVLAELAPMAQVGPVGLREVQLVLSPRLQQVASPPPGVRHGKVFVAPADAARGLAFDVVFVPGLAEKLFPRKIGEEPILLDAVREVLSPGLATNERRLEAERLALHLAVGAACERVVLSYPRLDVDGARPRVPSFYALEALRAAEGVLPSFEQLSQRAETTGLARLGWPAPSDPTDAIDAAEFDLARLATLEGDDEASRGAARYLMTANRHLARALRFRARRWNVPGWTTADGLVKPSEAGRRALAAHALSARSYSPTALQHYSLCPYRFFLQAVWKLAPREEPEAIEELDPLQRGSLVHAVQFSLFGALRDADLLPVTPDRLEAARHELDTVLEKVAADFADHLSPAIDRVWHDGVESVRADLREWLRRQSEDGSGFVPWRFELSFGLPSDRDADPASQRDPVTLDAGLCLRGSIDLVEKAENGHLRVTDHKTGKERFEAGAVIDGGRALQPVLYALAIEKLFPGQRVESGRLYYCTSAGGFEEREVALDDAARAAAAQVAETVGAALDGVFLPAAPDRDACRWCDYLPVCGPTRSGGRRASIRPTSPRCTSCGSCRDGSRRRSAAPDRRAPRRDAIRRGGGGHGQDHGARVSHRGAAAQRSRDARRRRRAHVRGQGGGRDAAAAACRARARARGDRRRQRRAAPARHRARAARARAHRDDPRVLRRSAPGAPRRGGRRPAVRDRGARRSGAAARACIRRLVPVGARESARGRATPVAPACARRRCARRARDLVRRGALAGRAPRLHSPVAPRSVRPRARDRRTDRRARRAGRARTRRALPGRLAREELRERRAFRVREPLA
jgi:CRISPR/Cas system-associated exonuclease Cas4 (RecB family)